MVNAIIIANYKFLYFLLRESKLKVYVKTVMLNKIVKWLKTCFFKIYENLALKTFLIFYVKIQKGRRESYFKVFEPKGE